MRRSHSIRARRAVGRFLIYAVLIAGSFCFLIPFLWMVSTALKGAQAIFVFPPEWIPNPPVWSNYVKAWTIVPFNTFLINTLLICVLTVAGTLFSCSLTAFGFARLKFRGRNFLFILVLASMMIPFEVTVIPLYAEFRVFGWINTLKSLIVPSFFGNAFYIFLLRQYFMTIPTDLDEAAIIDGCNTFQIYYRIILPLIRPALVTVGIFQFMGAWNDFMGPLIFLNDQSKFTLTLGLNLFKNSFMTEWQNMMCIASIITLVPMLIFFVAQRYLIGGIAMTGSKN